MSGKKNTFSASLYPEGKEKEPIYTVDGQWTDAFTIKDAKTKKTIDTYDPKVTKVTPLTIAPIEEQDEMESRRAWKKVADAIAVGDMDRTSAEKSLIENRQRDMRKLEKEQGTEWQRRYFSRAEKYPVFEKLAEKIGEAVNDNLTNGVWMFDKEKAEKVASIPDRAKGAKEERERKTDEEVQDVLEPVGVKDGN